MSPGLRARLPLDAKQKVKKVPCNFKYILEQEAKDYLEKLVDIFDQPKRMEKALAFTGQMEVTNHSSKDDVELTHEEEEASNSISKFEKLMISMDVLYYMDRPKHG